MGPPAAYDHSSNSAPLLGLLILFYKGIRESPLNYPIIDVISGIHRHIVFCNIHRRYAKIEVLALASQGECTHLTNCVIFSTYINIINIRKL